LPGGRYKPLGEHDLTRIHETALDVLETIGMGDPIPETRERALAAGCRLNEQGRLCFPRALIEDIIARAPRRFTLHAPDPAFDHEIGGNHVYFLTAGEAVRMVDPQTGRYRPSTIADVYDTYRLADSLEHIHEVCQVVVATEITDRYAHDMSVAYAALAGTRKTFGFSTGTAAHVDKAVALFDLALGGEGKFLKRPFWLVGHCPIVSPLRFATDTSQVAVRCAELGLVADMCTAPQAGATAPAALAGALVQSVAETLGALAQIDLTRRGAKMMFGVWPFVSDLRTGAFSGGGGEQALLMAASAQLQRFYGLPGSVAAGMTDAKQPDYQAGFEKGISIALAGLAGGDRIAECAGMMSSLMGVSLESMVMDNDLIGTVQRALRGIEVTDETLSFDVIRRVVDGPGHYLGQPQTLELMETEYLYPSVADRSSLAQWEAGGLSGALDRARERVRDILKTHYPSYIEATADEAIRRAFPIALPREAMHPTQEP